VRRWAGKCVGTKEKKGEEERRKKKIKEVWEMMIGGRSRENRKRADDATT